MADRRKAAKRVPDEPKASKPPADRRYLYGERAARLSLAANMAEFKRITRLNNREVMALMGRDEGEYQNLFRLVAPSAQDRRGVAFIEIIGMCYAMDVDPMMFISVDYSLPLRPEV